MLQRGGVACCTKSIKAAGQDLEKHPTAVYKSGLNPGFTRTLSSRKTCGLFWCTTSLCLPVESFECTIFFENFYCYNIKNRFKWGFPQIMLIYLFVCLFWLREDPHPSSPLKSEVVAAAILVPPEPKLTTRGQKLLKAALSRSLFVSHFLPQRGKRKSTAQTAGVSSLSCTVSGFTFPLWEFLP